MRADELTDADELRDLPGLSLARRQATQRAAAYSHAIQLLSDAKTALRRVELVAENDPRCIDA